MIVTVQTMIPNNLLPTDLDLSDYSDAGEFANELYTRSRDYGLIMIPVSAHVDGNDSPVAVATATIEEIWALHESSEEHGEAFGKWLSAQGEPSSDMTEWGSNFEECYQGEHTSLEDWAREFMEDCWGDLYLELDNSNMLRYFDFESWAESDLGHDYTWVTDGFGSVFVFRDM